MPIWLWTVLALVAAFVAVSLFWRYGSRKTSAPCPVWLAWMLAPSVGGKPLGRGRAIDELGLAPGMRVADVGCGPGRLTLPIAKAVGPEGEVVALDLQQKMLDLMHRRVDAAGLHNVREICAGAGDGHLPKDHFDRAVLSTVLGEIPDRERALREIRDALKPGGYLVVAEVVGDPHYQFKKKVIELAERAGLRPGEISGGFFAYRMRLYRSVEG
jgi:ubiquinone/menaquinone biosynthesis C-methylase UbiE